MIKLLLALLAGAKFGKIALTAGTMLLSVITYAWIYGWRYAVAFVALLFVHECGHLLVARQKGYAVGAPVFIPFVGAWISLGSQALAATDEAEIALGGPVLGSVGAFLCYLYARHDGGQVWLAIAYAGFLLNLFNLIPARPLDGGRVVRAVSEKIWIVGAPALLALFVWRPNPLLLVILLLSLPDLWRAIKGWRDPPSEALTRSQRWSFGAAYLLLTATLAAMTLQLHGELQGS